MENTVRCSCVRIVNVATAKTISPAYNARCPVCHKKMDLIGKGDGQRFVCVCGHKEKLSAFEERKKKEGKGANKRDVNQYLKKQAKKAKKPNQQRICRSICKTETVILTTFYQLLTLPNSVPIIKFKIHFYNNVRDLLRGLVLCMT